MAQTNTRGISRLKYKTSSNGWVARYTREGVTFSQRFGDSKYGGEDSAFEGAKEWHAEIRELFPPMSRREYMQQQRANNASGHTGVYHYKGRTKGHTYYYWIAAWVADDGKRKTKRFSINKYGDEGAKELAIKHREKMISKLSDEWSDDYWNYRPGDRRARTPYHREIYGFEGEEIYRLHIDYERDRDLRDKKIDQMLADHGHLFCEICEFDFEAAYGTLGKGIIEVHHVRPLSELRKSTKIHLSDLMCLCANCHLVIHNGDELKNLRTLKMIHATRKTKTS